TQTLKLSTQFAFCVAWIRRWEEWSRLEALIPAKRFVEPYGELPCHLQLVERLSSVASVLMGCLIAGFAQFVKQLGDLRIDALTLQELVNQFELGVVFFDSDPCVSCGVLG